MFKPMGLIHWNGPKPEAPTGAGVFSGQGHSWNPESLAGLRCGYPITVYQHAMMMCTSTWLDCYSFTGQSIVCEVCYFCFNMQLGAKI